MCNTWKGPLCSLRTMQAQISLCIGAGWSGPSLSAYRINGYCNICQQRILSSDCTDPHTDLDLHCMQIVYRPFSWVVHHMFSWKHFKKNLSRELAYLEPSIMSYWDKTFRIITTKYYSLRISCFYFSPGTHNTLLTFAEVPAPFLKPVSMVISYFCWSIGVLSRR